MSKSQKAQQKYALVSVYDKAGILALARIFTEAGINIISTGGSAKYLTENGIKIIPIEKITHSPEIFDGRMKTISFQIGAGLLYDRRNSNHTSEAKDLNIPQIDFVVNNFYPFWKNPGIEMIDIGGPTMVRAAAKNYESVTVLFNPKDYELVGKEVEDNGQTSLELRKKLSAKAFAYVASYDSLIANYFQKETKGTDQFISLQNGINLRYGENPHQRAKYFNDFSKDPLGLGYFKLLQGKETSYNNYLDLDSGLQAISFVGDKKPTCVILKHTNPCGVAVCESLDVAFHKAWYESDPLAAFGGVIIFNRAVDKNLAIKMLEDKKFFEIVAAPSFDKEALEVFSKKPKLQLLENKLLENPKLLDYEEIRKVRGGYLVQDLDTYKLQKSNLKVVTKKQPTKEQIDDLLLAWKISQVSKSNCVVAVKNGVLVSSGVGQQDRKRCCELCVSKATQSLLGSVAATDGFFPFRDGPDILIKAGIKAIIQPGGSIRDQETIDACNEAGISMIMTGIRAFKH